MLSATFLGVSAALSKPSLVLAQTAEAAAGLKEISEFLTGKQIDAALAARAGSALTRHDANFPNAIAALADFIAKGHIADVEALSTAPGFDGEIRTAAQELISALYVGFVGDPKPLSSEDNVEFVTFTEALTYRLTHNYTPIPSYSRWSTNYWEHLPDGI